LLVFSLDVDEVLVVVFVLLLLLTVDLLKLLPHHYFLLLNVLLHPPLAFLPHLALDVLLQPQTGLTLELVHLFDVGAEFLEAGGVLTEAQVLGEGGGTTRAASRCSALIVFLLACSHISLARSEMRTTNSR
jgi:hypothetical protein